MTKLYPIIYNTRSLKNLNSEEMVGGFWLNPPFTFLNSSYTFHIKELLKVVTDKPLIVDTFSANVDEIYHRALLLSALSPNIYVKIPVYDSDGVTNSKLLTLLSKAGVKVCAVGVVGLCEIEDSIDALNTETPCIICLSCDELSEHGRDPIPFMAFAEEEKQKNQLIMWSGGKDAFEYKRASNADADMMTCSIWVAEKILRDYEMCVADISDNWINAYYRITKEEENLGGYKFDE